MWQQTMNFIDCETTETIIRKLKCLTEPDSQNLHLHR